MAIPQQAIDLQTKVQKIVMAGMKVMYDPQTFQMLLDGITAEMPMPQKLAMEVAGVLKIVDGKSANGLPPETVAPSAMLLMYELAEFMKQSGAGNPTKEDIMGAMPILQKVLVDTFSKSGKANTQSAQPAQPQGLIAQQQGMVA